MKKVFFLLSLLVALVLQASAQRGSQIQLTRSESIKGVGMKFAARFIKPVFTHEGSTLAADSADYKQAANAFDAFGHVVITQPNGTVIYADQLNYDGNSRIAILTNNVRMIDGDATISTNYLTYNLGTRIGTYIGGGKIENGQNVLTSQNGYYFGNSRDAYFRYDVVVNTPDALIKTDTLKYNTESKVSWFYGPTKISGKGQNKQSKLYTENGRYNTITDQAWFGKKNLYTEGSKSLKGDSLYYDGKQGFGKAINNITFLDTVQKVILKGNQGIYRKRDESALVTKNAYVIIETEQDSAKVDSIWMAADTLITKLIPMKNFVAATNQELKSDQEIDTDPVVEGEGVVVPSMNEPTAPVKLKDEAPVATAEKPRARRGLFGRKNKQQPPVAAEESVKTDVPGKAGGSAALDKRPAGVDSTIVPMDSLAKPAKAKRDTALKLTPDTVLKAASKAGATFKDGKSLQIKTDSTNKSAVRSDTLGKKRIDPADTVKTRVIYAFHKVKIFKSDLQSRSDSAFYSYADSIIRCYRNPIIWTQGSQLTADTIYMQMKNRKLDNMLLQHNGFIVSTEGDSTKFNQVKGKVVTGIFENNKLKSMFVDGNAESVYYSIEDSAYTGMNRSLSSRMRLSFADSKLQQVIFVRKPEGKYYPIEKMPKDIEILEGFIWKPKDRPRSKEEIIPGLNRKKATAKGKSSDSGKVTPKSAKQGSGALRNKESAAGAGLSAGKEAGTGKSVGSTIKKAASDTVTKTPNNTIKPAGGIEIKTPVGTASKRKAPAVANKPVAAGSRPADNKTTKK